MIQKNMIQKNMPYIQYFDYDDISYKMKQHNKIKYNNVKNLGINYLIIYFHNKFVNL